MPHSARRLGTAVVSLVGLLVLLVLALPYVVSLDSMRARAIAGAEAALHRKVEIGRMRLQILSGLGARVEAVAVRNQAGFDTPAIVSADRVSIKVAFLPLLSGRIEVRKLVLDGVTVTIERGPDGALSIADLVTPGKKEGAPASGTPAAALFVSTVEIERGRAVFVDRRVVPGQTVTLSLEDLNGRLTDIGSPRPARFDLAARLLASRERNVTLVGTLGPAQAGGSLGEVPLEAAFAAKGLALAHLAPYVAAFREFDPGTFSADVKIAGNFPGAVSLSGRVSLDPAAASANVPAVEGTLAVALDWAKGSLVVRKSLLDVGKLPLAVEGRIDALRGTPQVDLSIGTPGDVGLDSVTGLPGLAGRFPADVRLAGRVRVELRLQGPAPGLDVRGSADAAPFGVTRGGARLFEGPSVHASLESRGKAPLSGRVLVPSGKLQNVPFENLRADWTWDKGALTLVPSAGVFGGTLAGRLESDFSRPKSESRLLLDVRGVKAQPLVESATTQRGVFAGVVNGKIQVTSPGLGWETVSKSARGDGTLTVTDADLRTVQIMPEVARVLSAVGKVAGFQVPASLEQTKFSTLATSVQLADGRLRTPDLTLSGRDVSVTADGSLGLDATLSYEGRVVLGPSVVKALGSTGRALADSAGRLALPFRATGAVRAPKVVIDESVVLDLGRRALSRAAQEKIGGAAGKAIGGILGGEGEKSSPLDALQQLLGSPQPTPQPTPR
jgi:hypothetical protein